MEFGKLESLVGVDWRLRPDPELNALMLGALAPAEVFRVYVGSTAWGQKDLLGSYYPVGTRADQFLPAYGRQMNVVELNTSFYRVPDRDQVMKWRADTPDDFMFCPKVNKLISQANDLGVLTTRTLDFAKAVQHFEQKLGPCFLQLPSDFSTARLDALLSWLDTWPAQLKLAVELRHASWFGGSRGNSIFDELAGRGMGAVITDVAGRRDAAHMHVTAPFTFVRWVGTMGESDLVRLDAWAERLVAWGQQGLAEAYFFTHEPEGVPSVAAAEAFVGFLRKHENSRAISTRGPQLASAEETRATSQGELFG